MRQRDGQRAWLGKPAGQTPDLQTQPHLQSTSWLCRHRQGNLLKNRWHPHKKPYRILPGTHCAWGLSQLLFPQNNPGMEQTTKQCHFSAHRGTASVPACTTGHAQPKPWPATIFIVPVNSFMVLSTVLGHCFYPPCSCPNGLITFSDDPGPIRRRRRSRRKRSQFISGEQGNR